MEKRLTLDEAFAARRERYKMLDRGIDAAGWRGRELRILEFGCSIGDGAAHLAAAEPVSVTAIDMDAQLIGEAKIRHSGAARCRFLAADARRLPFPDAEFDGAFGEAAFSVIREKGETVAELWRVLRPGGRVLINDYAVKREPGEELRGRVSGVPCLSGVGSMADYEALFAAQGFGLLYRKEDFFELARIFACLRGACGEELTSAFSQEAGMTYCQMVFGKTPLPRKA